MLATFCKGILVTSVKQFDYEEVDCMFREYMQHMLRNNKNVIWIPY